MEYWTQMELRSEFAALPLCRHLAKCLQFDEGLTATAEKEGFCGGVRLLTEFTCHCLGYMCGHTESLLLALPCWLGIPHFFQQQVTPCKSLSILSAVIASFCLTRHGRNKMLQYYITSREEDNALLDCHIIDFSPCFHKKTGINPGFPARSQP